MGAGQFPQEFFRFLDVRGASQQEYDFLICAIWQIKCYLHGGARIHTGAVFARKSFAVHGLRVLQVPVPPDKLESVSGKGRLAGVIDFEKGDPIGKCSIVPVPEKQGATVCMLLRNDMHARLCGNITKHDPEVAGGGKPASPARLIF